MQCGSNPDPLYHPSARAVRWTGRLEEGGGHVCVRGGGRGGAMQHSAHARKPVRVQPRPPVVVTVVGKSREPAPKTSIVPQNNLNRLMLIQRPEGRGGGIPPPSRRHL